MSFLPLSTPKHHLPGRVWASVKAPQTPEELRPEWTLSPQVHMRRHSDAEVQAMRLWKEATTLLSVWPSPMLLEEVQDLCFKSPPRPTR